MGKQYKVFKRSNLWSTEKLRKEVEDTLNKASQDECEIISVISELLAVPECQLQ